MTWITARISLLFLCISCHLAVVRADSIDRPLQLEKLGDGINMKELIWRQFGE